MRDRPASRSPKGIAGPLAAVFVVTLLCGTAPDESQLFAQRRLRIAGMTHAEVEQLKRNYDEFRKLPPERRKALLDLDDEIKQDSTGHFLKLVTEYNRWLSGLSPFEQEKIQSKTDPIERAQLVKSIHDEQQKRQALAAIDGIGRQAITLQPPELGIVLKAVEENFLTAESRKRISDQLTGRDRHLRILQVTLQQLRASRGETQGAVQSLVTTIIDAMPNDAVKGRVMSRAGGRPRRQTVGQVLGRSLVNEWRKEIEAVFPKQAAIDAEIARKLKAASSGKREQQEAQFATKQGRRMVGVQMVLSSDDQFKDLRPVFFWLASGLQPRAAIARSALQIDDSRTDEAENKTKAAE